MLTACNLIWYITGSDQVWNDRCARFDRNFFLDFPCARLKKKSVLCRKFWNETNSLAEKRNEYKRRLSDFAAYSVRENEGKEILSDLLGVNASVNCDPTLLLRFWWDWNDITTDTVADSEPYILVYYVTKTEEVQKKANAYAKEKGCKLVILPLQYGY